MLDTPTKSVEQLWTQFIDHHLSTNSASLVELQREAANTDSGSPAILKAKSITLDSLTELTQNTTIICDELAIPFAPVDGPAHIVMTDTAIELQIIARRIIGEVNIDGPGTDGDRGEDGKQGEPGIAGLPGNAGRKGKSASTFHSAKRGKSGGPGETGGLGGLGTEGGGGTAGGDGRDVTVVAESFEPGTILNVNVPGGKGGTGGVGGFGGQGGVGGDGGVGGKGGDGFKPFHGPARGGRGGLGGNGGQGRDGNNGGPGGNGGDGGNLTVFFRDPANVPVVNFNADGGVGGPGGPGGSGGLGGSGGRGGVGGAGGDGGNKSGPSGENGADGIEGLPGVRGPDGSKGDDGEVNLVWEQKPLTDAESFVAMAALALGDEKAATALGIPVK